MTARPPPREPSSSSGESRSRPSCPGSSSTGRRRLQGRRGPTPLQPYRELRRLWGKSAVAIEGTTAVYRLAPAVAAASVATAVLLVPVASRAPNLGLGRDVLALAGVLTLARFVLAAASWDTANGFSLMGASRDLTISVFVEAALVPSLALAALLAGTTNLPGMVAATAGTAVWSSPALPLGAIAFALVAIAETGRQPVDNPDTHLELTMIHEGPLLEYAGRDLAMLQWAARRPSLARARPRRPGLPPPRAGRLGPAGAAAGGAGRPLRRARPDRDAVAKMRILLVPRLLARRPRSRCSGSRLARGALVNGRSPGRSSPSAWASSSSGAGRSRSGSSPPRRSSSPVIALDDATAGATSRGGARPPRGRARLALPPRRLPDARAAAGARRDAPLGRAGVAIAFALALTWLVPTIGLESRNAERGVLALVAFGVVAAAMRRATLFQVLGIVLVENGARARRARSCRAAARRSRSSSASPST